MWKYCSSFGYLKEDVSIIDSPHLENRGEVTDGYIPRSDKEINEQLMDLVGLILLGIITLAYDVVLVLHANREHLPFHIWDIWLAVFLLAVPVIFFFPHYIC